MTSLTAAAVSEGERTTQSDYIVVDGNEAAARIAHRVSEVIAIYPITPASPMGELSDAWSQSGRTNLWGAVPDVIEMQSEGGAAGAVHGALQTGALTTTFTASQGLLLMIPNLYKIAGELLPSVIHVAARSVATHALSIFGDHSDVMAVRQTGVGMLCSGSVQQAQDLALIAHAAALRTRVPLVHFFDGFRTSHEVAKIEPVGDEVIRALIDDDLVIANRLRSLDPDRPVVRGTAQNPDVFFQATEAANRFHDAVPAAVQKEMDSFAELTGRRYRIFDYHGHPQAERVVVIMGSGGGTVQEVVDRLLAEGERVGVLVVHLYRPFDVGAFVRALPRTTKHIGVLDRTREHGSAGEPLYLDVVAALMQTWPNTSLPTVTRGRYGLSSKEFTPAMVMSLFHALRETRQDQELTLGIVDDVTKLSLPYDPDSWEEPNTVQRAVFYGLGSDGTVGANKNSVKIIGGRTPLHVQGYFVYDSKKAGSTTISHLRFGPTAIRSAYLIQQANFVGVHHFGTLQRQNLLRIAAPGAKVLINSPFGQGTWDRLSGDVQQEILEKNLEVWVVDGGKVARANGLGNRINTVLQTCFFSLTKLLPLTEAVTAIKGSIATTYGKRSPGLLDRNYSAVDASLAALKRLVIPDRITSDVTFPQLVPTDAPDFIQRVTARIIAGDGDSLPVSAFPVDGTFPSGTSKYEKRTIATEIPIWDPEICIDCARCALVCPHAAIRIKSLPASQLESAPASFRHKAWKDRSDPTMRGIIQVAPDDCTGCGVCVTACPATSKEVVKHKSINMEAIEDHLDAERVNFQYFLDLPENDRTTLRLGSVKGSQLAQPLFEFSGACAGCGETPYLKLLTQLMGDRMIVANATGCSSIYGANLPTTPWTTNDQGRGPAWANSLFEDNAEFGLGIRLAVDHHHAAARHLLMELAPQIGDLATTLLAEAATDEAAIATRRQDLLQLQEWLDTHPGPLADRLASLAQHLVPRSVWLVGGDGWAYDIGFGGLDHVLASGRDVNVLVLDTEVYSNTGGQTSKATPRAAVAKFSAGGKSTAKKDLGMIAMAHADVYVAHIALGANMTQTVKALNEAAAHPGPSLVIAYSPCIAHGMDMTDMLDHQRMAAETGYWPLYRYDPSREETGDRALHLDSRKPTMAFKEFAKTEARFSLLGRVNPAAAADLMAQAQQDIDDRWHLYEQLVDVQRTARYSDLIDGHSEEDDRSD